MILLKILMRLFKIWGVVSLIIVALNVYRFRYQIGVYLRKQPPLDWPVWVYRARRWLRLEWREIKNRRGEVAGILFVFAVLVLLFLGIIATSPA